MEERKKERPLVVAIDEAKRELVQAINNIVQTQTVPFSILDMIVSEIGAQIREAAKAELAHAQTQMAAPQEPEEE